jgi:hypothetical protein
MDESVESSTSTFRPNQEYESFQAGSRLDPRIQGALALCHSCNRTIVCRYLAAVDVWTDMSGQSHGGHILELHPNWRLSR